MHTTRAAELRRAQEDEDGAATCPECGVATAPAQLVTWGHCRACRTADSRAVQPLRW